MEKLTALSPWSEIDTSEFSGLSPRLDTLNGKTIGMFGDFMILGTYMLNAIEKALSKRFPKAKFSYIQYCTETTEIIKDSAFKQEFDEWIQGVDCIIASYGSVPSSSLFLGYNAAYMEKSKKPTVMLVAPRTYPAGIRGCKAKGVPSLKVIAYDVTVDKVSASATREMVESSMAGDIEDLCGRLCMALTGPITEEEAAPVQPEQKYARTLYTGTAREISEQFYRYGWTNGAPIEIPTPEAVEEMLTGTDLPADYVVGCIPPKMGLATVKSIAINAVMAGCLPTYMPVLIAAVKGALDPRILLEGWCCSQSTWGPVVTVSGSIVNDIGLNTDSHALTPSCKANAAIGRAFGYILMNIGGIRPTVEDLSEMGHEFRLGFCMGDSWDNNPWGPVHMDFGMKREDNAVTMFWPMEHHAMSGRDIPSLLKWLCTFNPLGWDPGACVIFSPKAAKMFADAGWTKKKVLNYMVEYCRHPASEVDWQWLKGNNHPPITCDYPEVMTHSTRVFWSDDHMFATVAGGFAGNMITVLAGGGDHGGPSCAKIELPKNWDSLVKKYHDLRPDYIDY